MALRIRTITLGANLLGTGAGWTTTAGNLVKRIPPVVRSLREECEGLVAQGALTEAPTIRLATTPLSAPGNEWTVGDYVAMARQLDELAERERLEFVGGFCAFLSAGSSPRYDNFLEAMPSALADTKRVAGFIQVGDTKSGISIDAINTAVSILKAIGARAKGPDAAARFAIVSNNVSDTPFIPLSYHSNFGDDLCLNCGIGLIEKLVWKLEKEPAASVHRLSAAISDLIYDEARRADQLVARLCRKVGVPMGNIDLSIGPEPDHDDRSLVRLFSAMGVDGLGTAGSVAALALLNDALKKGGSAGTDHLGGLVGAFVSIAEDPRTFAQLKQNPYILDRMLAMTAVCSVGLDMIGVPADTPDDVIAGLAADAMCIACRVGKTTAIRLIPHGKSRDSIEFTTNPKLGRTIALPIATARNAFTKRGGHIPRFIQSFPN